MHAISIQQPWASLIIAGKKPVENRNWSTSFRGPLLIHAGKKWDGDGAKFIIENHPELRSFAYPSNHHMGALIGQATMTGCVKNHDSEWFFGPYGFVFINPREFHKPIPYKGQLGIFIVPDNILYKNK